MSHHSGGANIRKLMEREVQRYGLENPAAIFVIEGTANSLDEQTAGAKRIDIDLIEDKFEKKIRIRDDGRGMTNYNQFVEYHKYGSISKVPTPGDIGFVGVGINVILPYAICLFTETISKSFSGASRWWFPDGEQDTSWDDVHALDDEYQVKNTTGTCVTVLLKKEKYAEEITVDYIYKLVQTYYVGVLIGHYGKDIELYVNGQKVMPKYIPDSFIQPSGEHRIRTLNKIGWFEKKQYPPKCYFFKTDKPMPLDDQGIFIIVGKKMIQNQKDYFRHRVVPELEAYLGGYIVGDYLIDCIKTGKDGFQEGKKVYKEFYSEAAFEWNKFLELINAQRKAEELDEKTTKVIENIEKDIEKLLKKGPLSDLDIQLARKKRLLKHDIEPKGTKDVGVETTGGVKQGTLNTDVVITDVGGTKGGDGGDGPGVTGTGVQPTLDITATGDKTGKVQPRHVGQRRGGSLRINVIEDPRHLEVWYDAGSHFILINKSFSTYKYADDAGTKVLDYHIRRMVIDELIKQGEGTPEEMKQLFNQCFQEMI